MKSCPTPPLAVANRAIPEELQSWGVPPVPNAKKDSEAYTQWYKAYFLTKRTVQPYGAFRVGNSSFGFDTSKTGIQFNNENATSNQPKQSGYGLAKSLTAPASLILNFATANFVAPSAAQVYPCSGQYTQSEGSFWLGIDGISAQSNIVSSSDVLQVGLIDDIICEGNNIFQVLDPIHRILPKPPYMCSLQRNQSCPRGHDAGAGRSGQHANPGPRVSRGPYAKHEHRLFAFKRRRAILIMAIRRRRLQSERVRTPRVPVATPYPISGPYYSRTQRQLTQLTQSTP